MIERTIKSKIKAQFFKSKIILLIGPRQVGKTTLLKEIMQDFDGKSLWLNADEVDIFQQLDNAKTSTQLKNLFGDATLIIIDEAQQIDNIGLKLKLVADTLTNLQVIATGSSAFELLQKSNEPLTGRKKEFQMFALSFDELAKHQTNLVAKRNLESRLLFGSYPEVINNPGNEIEVLQDITTSYLYKDILQLDGIKKSALLKKLVLALALQVGSEVNYNELAKTVGNISPATVENYIDILEKAFIVFKLPALNRNIRNEIKKGKKIYFYDNGIRNAVINNFNSLNLRTDKGALWENYLISERYKHNTYQNKYCNSYFWRTFDQAEVDYIEEYNGALHLYEIKWNAKKHKFPNSILTSYTIATTSVVDIDNFEEFVL